jgi:hypothetical protein
LAEVPERAALEVVLMNGARTPAEDVPIIIEICREVLPSGCAVASTGPPVFVPAEGEAAATLYITALTTDGDSAVDAAHDLYVLLRHRRRVSRRQTPRGARQARRDATAGPSSVSSTDAEEDASGTISERLVDLQSLSWGALVTRNARRWTPPRHSAVRRSWPAAPTSSWASYQPIQETPRPR